MPDTETYETLMEQLNHKEAVSAVRAIIREVESAGPPEVISEAETKRRHAVLDELVAETERLGLYR